MSTISKLDVVTRRSRKDRKAMLQALRRDVLELTGLIERGNAKLAAIDAQECPFPAEVAAAKMPIFEQMTKIIHARLLANLTLKHLTKVCKDPKRSGATKDAILRKLGAA